MQPPSRRRSSLGAAADADIFCLQEDPAGCEENEHDAYYLPPSQQHQYNASTGTGQHLNNECFEKLCEEKHGPLCIMFAAATADLEALRGSLAHGSVREVSTMLDQHQAHFVLNTERSAIQILNCTGEVVAHLPVSKSFARELRAAE